MDARWREVLATGQRPGRSGGVADALVARASEVAACLPKKKTPPLGGGPIDLVVPGNGFKCLYYLGVVTVLEAAGVEVRRFAGASSGAMLAFELLVLGTRATVDLYAAYGALQDERPAWTFAGAAWRADRHWRMLADRVFPQEAAPTGAQTSDDDASSSSSSSSSWELVEGRVYASVTRLGLTSGATNVIYSEYGSQRRARDAYYATGTGLTRIDGFCATDGGVTNNLPLFGDKLRPQLLVRTKGLAAIRDDMIARFSLADVDATVRLGQDDCVAFLERAAAAAPPSNGDCEKLPGDAVLVSPGGNIQLLPRGQTSI